MVHTFCPTKNICTDSVRIIKWDGLSQATRGGAVGLGPVRAAWACMSIYSTRTPAIDPRGWGVLTVSGGCAATANVLAGRVSGLSSAWGRDIENPQRRELSYHDFGENGLQNN